MVRLHANDCADDDVMTAHRTRVMRRRGDVIQRLWAALRIMGTVPATATLAMAARASEREAAAYLRLLERARYVVARQVGWRLCRNTGPVAPRRAMDCLIDGNSGAATPLQRVDRQPLLAAEVA